MPGDTNAYEYERLHDVSVLTGNLHSCVCRMLKQVETWGPLYLLNDLWGERCQHVAKFLAKYRSNPQNCHIVLANTFLAQSRLSEIENEMLQHTPPVRVDGPRLFGAAVNVDERLRVQLPDDAKCYTGYYDGYDRYDINKRANVAVGLPKGPYVYGKLLLIFSSAEYMGSTDAVAYGFVLEHDRFQQNGFDYVRKSEQRRVGIYVFKDIACPVEFLWEDSLDGVAQSIVLFEYFHPSAYMQDIIN